MINFEKLYLNKRIIVHSEQLDLIAHATVIKVVNDEDDENNTFLYINNINLIDGEEEDLGLFKNSNGDYSINVFEAHSIFEPKFQIGEWIKNNKLKHLIPIKVDSFYWSAIENCYAYKFKGLVFYEKDVIRWVPKKNELCIFKLGDIGILARFSHINEDGKYKIKTKTDFLVFDECEPFIKIVPDFLKNENKE